MSDLHELTATEQRLALDTGDVSARDLVEHYLDRILRLDPQVRAFATVVPDVARAAADRADRMLRAGDRGPVLGLPLGVKDMHATAGVETAWGSRALRGTVPTDDTRTVGLLRAGGAVLVGKTTTSELGAACFRDAGTEADGASGPTVTPYDLSRYASGSSSGAAAAVAAGLLPVAHGSDGAGSIRTPAATCLLVGVKPSRGLVSPAPAASFLAWGTEGPLARTVADATLLLSAMVAPSDADLHGWQPTTSLDPADLRPPDRLRVGVSTDTGLAGVAVHPESHDAVRRAAGLLDQLGHEVVEVAPPTRLDPAVREALVGSFAVSVSLAVAELVHPARQDLLTPYTRWLCEQGARLSGVDVARHQGVLARAAAAVLAHSEGYDVLLTPTTNGPPVQRGHFLAEGAEAVAERMLAWSCFTPWANLTGQPAVSLPTHLDVAGLPHAIQLVGPRHGDLLLLRLAAQLETAGLWQHHHPPCWQG